MWTCLYLSHIVVIIMIIIATLGIVYGISQKKIKVYQVIIIFLFCVISMALVTGVTSMQYIRWRGNVKNWNTFIRLYEISRFRNR